MTTLAQHFGRTLLTGLVAILPIAVTAAVLWWLGSTAERLLGGLLRAILPEVAYFPGLGVLVGIGLLFLLGLLLRAYAVQALFDVAERWLQRLPVVKTIYGAVQDVTRMFSGEMSEAFGQTVLVRLPGTEGLLIGMVTREDLSPLSPSLFPPHLSPQTSSQPAKHKPSRNAKRSGSPTRVTKRSVTDSTDLPSSRNALRGVAGALDLPPGHDSSDEAPSEDDQRVAVYLPMSYMIGGYTLLIPRSQITPIDLSFEDAMRFAVTAGLSVSTQDALKISNRGLENGDAAKP